MGSIRPHVGADQPSPARRTAGEGSTVDFLDGDWNVVRHISDHQTGEVGEFRGQASFRRCPDGLVLSYHEHGELRFGSHRGPANRSLLYRELADGSADVRFADGREFYRLDLRSGTWSAEHPCRADHYRVTVRRLSPDSFCETWRVTGPAKDYELATTYTRTACQQRAGGPQ
jgi:Family of unknown function (DUF6314)